MYYIKPGINRAFFLLIGNCQQLVSSAGKW